MLRSLITGANRCAGFHTSIDASDPDVSLTFSVTTPPPPNFNLSPYSSSHPNTLDALPFIAMAVVTLIYSLVQVRFELETLPFQAPKCQDYR